MPNAGPQLVAKLSLDGKAYEAGLKAGVKQAEDAARKIKALDFTPFLRLDMSPLGRLTIQIGNLRKQLRAEPFKLGGLAALIGGARGAAASTALIGAGLLKMSSGVLRSAKMFGVAKNELVSRMSGRPAARMMSGLRVAASGVGGVASSVFGIPGAIAGYMASQRAANQTTGNNGRLRRTGTTALNLNPEEYGAAVMKARRAAAAMSGGLASTEGMLTKEISSAVSKGSGGKFKYDFKAIARGLRARMDGVFSDVNRGLLAAVKGFGGMLRPDFGRLRGALAPHMKQFAKGFGMAAVGAFGLATTGIRAGVGMAGRGIAGGVGMAGRGIAGGVGMVSSAVIGSVKMLGEALDSVWQGLKKVGLYGSIAGAALAYGIKSAYDYGKSLEILSRNTGFSTKAMSVFKVAMDDTGVSMELFQRTSRMIAKEVMLGMKGDQAATAGMEQIGIHVRDLMKMKPEEQFMAVGNAIAALKNPTVQAAAAVSRFGSESAKMLSFFKNKDALANAAEAVGQQAEIFERSGKTFEKISVRIGHIKVKAMGFFAGAAESIMPMVDRFSAIFNKMDFSAWGAKMGAAINKAMAWLVTFWREPGKTTAYFWEYAKVGAMDLENALLSAAMKFGPALAASMEDALSERFPKLMSLLTGKAAGMKYDAQGKMIRPFKYDKEGKPVGMNEAYHGGPVDFAGAGAARAKLAAMRPNAAFNQATTDLGQRARPVMSPDAGLLWRLKGFGGMGRLGEKGSSPSSGLQGASMTGGLDRLISLNMSPGMRDTESLSGMRQGAYDQSNLLKHGELRRFRNARVARGLLEQRRPGETANGDRQRAKAVARELERKKLHAGSSEQLLSDIASYTDEVAKNTRPFVQ